MAGEKTEKLQSSTIKFISLSAQSSVDKLVGVGAVIWQQYIGYRMNLMSLTVVDLLT